MKPVKRRKINARKRPIASTDPVASARTAGLRYVSDLAPGIRRKRRGSGFVYLDASNRRLRNRGQLRRIKRLAIPPAWRDVWISPREDGHLQATGRDAKGRKQYRYHEDWRMVRDETKYERMIAFAEALPKIRKRVEADLRIPSLTREKVLATVIQLLQISLIRVGNEEYAQSNHSFGLTTMRNRHAEVVGSNIRFHFKGKSGKLHKLAVSDRRLARITEKCQDLPGQHLFEYVNDEGKPVPIHSDDVNEYLGAISGHAFTAKDFRTWTGTVLAAIALRKMEEVGSKRLAKKNVISAVESVAKALGNTPAICRKCYVHPMIIDSYMNGALANSLRLKADAELSDRLNELRPAEAAILAFLRDEMENRAKKKPQDLSTALTKSLAQLSRKKKRSGVRSQKQQPE
ncbi:MAG: DNA topoisomerase IB [Verrucomicrobia bacterium]|nr:DNA topoisomerase IB [Verrucomicrobiota bacterium]